MKILRTTDRNFRYDFGKIYKNRMEVSESIGKSVDQILDDIKRIGDQALIKYTEKFDQFPVTTKNMEVSAKEKANLLKKVPSKELKALELAAKRIEAFYKNHKSQSWTSTKEGVTLGLRYSPIEKVGIYVPGGKASYPSTVLMTAIPARVAGVSEVIMCSPWAKGEVNPATIAAAKIAGVDRIFKVGGVQAIASMAYGTKTIPQVYKIVGPGNMYVTWAKKMVFGQVDIDMVAGPSEVCILGDGTVDAKFVAADMLAQAEHDEMACSLLITNNSNYASRVEGEVRIQLGRLSRKDIAGVSIQKRALIVLVRTLEEGVELINDLAPEHLELLVKDASSYVDKIRNAGAIFVGPHTPETMGDYLAGPSHVLPTQGTAKYFSVLRVDDFMKTTSIVSLNESAFKNLASDAVTLATLEGLQAHARAVEIRLGK